MGRERQDYIVVENDKAPKYPVHLQLSEIKSAATAGMLFGVWGFLAILGENPCLIIPGVIMTTAIVPDEFKRIAKRISKERKHKYANEKMVVITKNES